MAKKAAAPAGTPTARKRPARKRSAPRMATAEPASSKGAAAMPSMPSMPSKPSKPSTVKVAGCVQKNEAPAGGYTLSDGTSIFRLTGVDVRDFVGRRVEIVGGAPRAVKIKGGLFPSPNVAGQAGAIDPARAAIAATDAAGAQASGAPPEFRVRSIKPITGSCTQ